MREQASGNALFDRVAGVWSAKTMHKKRRCVGLTATLLDFPIRQVSERSVVELGGFHRYRIVYSGFFNRDQTAVSY